jgi:TolB-like protein/Tfp pilus assembly protein PilF
MKRCPDCRRDYTDDTLSFCLEDGAPLVSGVPTASSFAGEPETAILPDAPISSERATRTFGARTPTSCQTRISGKLIAAVAVLAATLAGAAYFGYRYLESSGPEQINSIAVLPFENRSGTSDTDYLSDGLADSLIYRLSQLPDLKVSPTSSVIRYKGSSVEVAQIARELEVDAVLSGRLLQVADGLNISVQLIDARSKKLIWAEQYDRKMSDLLATQREIATTIAQKLQLKLSGNEKGLAKKYTDSNEAYQLYLKGRYHWDKRTRDDIDRGIEYFQQAIKLDPNFALAYVGIADSYNSLPGLNMAPTREKVPLAKAAAERAMVLDPTLAEAHAARATSIALLDFDWPEAEREFLRAIELDPNVAHTHYRYAIDYLIPMGRTDEAITEIERAVELEPINLIMNANLAGAYMYARQYDRALEKARKTHELEPGFGSGRSWLATVYNASGMHDEAIAVCEASLKNNPHNVVCLGSTGYAYARKGQRIEAEGVIVRIKEIGRTRYVSNLFLAGIYAALGSKDEAFAALERSIEQRDFAVARLKVERRYDTLRDDPRYKVLLKRMNLPE